MSNLSLDLSCSFCSAWPGKDVLKLLSGTAGITIIIGSSSTPHSSSSDSSKKFGRPSFANAAFLASKLCREGGRERVEQRGGGGDRREGGGGELGEGGEEDEVGMEEDGGEERMEEEG